MTLLGGVAAGLALARLVLGIGEASNFLTDPIWWLYLFWVPDFLN